MDRDGINEFLELVEMAEEVDNIGLYRRRNGEEVDFFQSLNDNEFIKRFRISKQTAIEILHQIEEDIEFPDNRNNPISPANQLLLTMRYYATGCFLITGGDYSHVSIATASRIVKRVSFAIANLRRGYINMPNLGEIDEIKRNFYEIAGFPNVIGTIDCNHVKIQSPGGEDAEFYRNRKGFFSLNVQTISDPHLRIRDIVARWPGSSHDSAIFHNSRVRTTFENRTYGNGVLLGDSAYPLKEYLMIPYLNPRNEAQHRYNASHIKTRNTIERQYGVLKRRFPSLSYGIRLNLDTTMAVIVACAVLHNICINRGEVGLPDNINIENDVDVHQVPEVERGINAGHFQRDVITNNYFN